MKQFMHAVAVMALLAQPHAHAKNGVPWSEWDYNMEKIH